MAVAYESVQTTAFASAGDITITKPTGLSVGDIMVAYITIPDNFVAPVTAPSGWSTLDSEDGVGAVYIFHKIADSSDVSASNFTFNLSGSYKVGGSITRISGGGYVATGGIGDDNSGDTSIAISTPLTPPVSDSILLMFFSGSGSGDTGRSISGYAITNDNPTWTEAYDFQDTTGNDSVMSMAYASRPEITSTGNFSATASSSMALFRGALVIISPTTSQTVVGSTGILTLAGNAGTVTGSANITGSTGILNLTGNAGIFSSPDPDWRNPDKSSAPSWVNPDKS